MNRIEERMALLRQRQEKALITYMMAGLPDLRWSKELMLAQERAGVDVIELGIPFSDPIADGPAIQDASYRSLCLGTNLKKVFGMLEEARTEGSQIPVVFLLYYNTILSFGLEPFAASCKKAGVDGIFVPDLPFEEQGELLNALQKEDGPIFISAVSPAAKDRMPLTLQAARGFVCCGSLTDGAKASEASRKKALQDLKAAKHASPVPIIIESDMQTADAFAIACDSVDGVLVGAGFLEELEKNGYDAEAVEAHCRKLQKRIRSKSI